MLTLPACATFDTISNAKPGTPVFFSGTRLDLNTLQQDEIALEKFNVSAPEYPLLDLPASLVFDLFISPLTGGVALFEVLTE